MLGALFLVVTGATLLAGPATAAPAGEPTVVVTIIEVSGLVDPIIADLIDTQLTASEARGDTALVLQLNSDGVVVDDATMDALLQRLRDSDVSIGVWVGPSGSDAKGDAARLLAAADISGLAPGSSVEVVADLAKGVDLRDRTAIGRNVGSELAVDLDLVDTDAPTVPEFVDALPGVDSEVVQTDDGPRRQLAESTRVRFAGLSLIDQLFHTVASPAVAYLLLTIGGALLIFELFTAGVGVAGVVGAGFLLLASYGLAVLPTTWIGLVLMGVAFVGFAIDVQTGVPRVWTAVAVTAYVVGSFVLFDGPHPSWLPRLVGIVGITLAMVGGMPTMVRTRFSTPTIGRDWMIGEVGIAAVKVAPDGVVTVRDAPWRARTNRATPIEAGDGVRVVSIDGLTLEVEPLEGAAADYRERSHRS